MNLYGHIYRLTNKINGKMYHGQTIRDLKDRWNEYITLQCKGQPKLYAALLKYGPDNFLFESIDSGSNQLELDNLERHYIKEFDSMHNGYNCNEGGNSNGTYIHTDKSKLKMSISHTGQKQSELTKQKRSIALTGIPRSLETRSKISKSRKGIVFSSEHRKNLSTSHKGHKPLESTKLKLSNSLKGRISPMLGRKHSMETKEKMKLSQQQRRQKLLSPQIKNGLHII